MVSIVEGCLASPCGSASPLICFRASRGCLRLSLICPGLLGPVLLQFHAFVHVPLNVFATLLVCSRLAVIGLSRCGLTFFAFLSQVALSQLYMFSKCFGSPRLRLACTFVLSFGLLLPPQLSVWVHFGLLLACMLLPGLALCALFCFSFFE